VLFFSALRDLAHQSSQLQRAAVGGVLLDARGKSTRLLPECLPPVFCHSAERAQYLPEERGQILLVARLLDGHGGLHEAYGLEDHAKRAHAFGHSTAAEAGRVAREAEAERLVLTHLRASRFVDPAELAAEAASAFGGPVEAARDLDAFHF
jgi:hypothetical protein